MSEMDNNIDNINFNIRICKICVKSEIEVGFQKSRKICIKCNSKRCNEKILARDPSYFNNIMKARYNAKKNINTTNL